VRRIEAAADPDGAFAMARVEPCSAGVCGDGYGRGGPSSSGAVLMLAAVALGRRGQAWLERPGLPACRSCCGAVSVRLALAGAAGDGVRRLAVAGVGVQVRGGSVIFDPLTDRLSWLCRLGKCPGRTPWHTISARLWKGHFTREWHFCWLLLDHSYIRKSLVTSRDGRI
jgi:hypothetical protein